jgi:BlaI family transcriptional regulator, penicillinase repressor
LRTITNVNTKNMSPGKKSTAESSLRKTIESFEAIVISDAESVVMGVLWRQSPLAAEEIVAALASERDWQESTVKTLINRLLKKGALSAEVDGRRYLYSPILARDIWLRSQSTSLLDRLFDGKVAPLVAHFSEHRKLTRDDIAELKRIVAKLEKK